MTSTILFVLFTDGDHQITCTTATNALQEWNDLKDMDCGKLTCMAIESDAINGSDVCWQAASEAEDESRLTRLGRKWMLAKMYQFRDADIKIRLVGPITLDQLAKIELIAETRREVIRDMANTMHQVKVVIRKTVPRKGFSVSLTHPLEVVAFVDGREGQANQVRDGAMALVTANGTHMGILTAFNGYCQSVITWEDGLSFEWKNPHSA